MQEETGEDGARVGAREREDHPDENEQSDDAPAPAELRAMHEAEERASEQDARNDTKGFREQWIEIAAEDGFLDERSDKDGHAHQKERGVAVLEELLNGHVFFGLNSRAGQRDENRQAAAAEKVNPRAAFPAVEIRLQLLPAQRAPEGQVAQNAQGDVEKEKDERVPNEIATKQQLGLVQQIVFVLLLAQVLLRSVVERQPGLDDDEACKREEHQNKEMSP